MNATNLNPQRTIRRTFCTVTFEFELIAYNIRSKVQETLELIDNALRLCVPSKKEHFFSSSIKYF